MAQIGIAVTKRTAFRDSVQEFSNVYHYSAAGANPSAAVAEALLDEVVAFEKTCHSTGVTFLQGRVWSSGGSIAANQMIVEKTLTGAGTMAISGGFDKERAYLIQWPAGVDVRGKPVTLKKWYHSCGFFGSHGLQSGVLDNSTGFTAADRTSIGTKAGEIGVIGAANDWQLCAESGRAATNFLTPVAHKYLEHHQLGDQWRG